MNGQPPASGITGSIWLKSTSSADQVLLSFANAITTTNTTTTYTALVAADTYDVYYSSGLLDGAVRQRPGDVAQHEREGRALAVVISGARHRWTSTSRRSPCPAS